MRKIWIVIGVFLTALGVIYIFKKDLLLEIYYTFLEIKHKITHPGSSF